MLLYLCDIMWKSNEKVPYFVNINFGPINFSFDENKITLGETFLSIYTVFETSYDKLWQKMKKWNHEILLDNIDPEAFFDDITTVGEHKCGDNATPVEYLDSPD